MQIERSRFQPLIVEIYAWLMGLSNDVAGLI